MTNYVKCILELCMNSMKKQIAANRDTYSLVYEIETKNIYDDFSKNKDMNRIQSKHYRIGACEMNQVIRFALMTQF